MMKKPNILREPPSDYSGDAIVLYSDPDGAIKIDVRLVRETLWLSQKQMADIFDKDSDTIGLHIRNIYKEGELGKAATTEDFSVVQLEGSRSIRRRMKFYNLDMIISVGYRVNSKRGTQFRIWATQVLRDHLVKGYSVNERRLKELKQSLKLASQVLERYDVTSDQARALLRVVADYAAALFLWFMEKNGILYRPDGSRHIADNALVAITLMIAESNPKQMDILTKVVVNLIKDGKQGKL